MTVNRTDDLLEGKRIKGRGENGNEENRMEGIEIKWKERGGGMEGRGREWKQNERRGKEWKEGQRIDKGE